MTTALDELSRALDLAYRELPSGTARSRLTHYCGRLWDLLRSADLIEADRADLASPLSGDARLPSPLVSCLAALAALVSEGIDGGQFASVSAKQTARLVLAALFARAHWCRRPEVHPLLAASCSHAVVETLELIWPALDPSKENA